MISSVLPVHPLLTTLSIDGQHVPATSCIALYDSVYNEIFQLLCENRWSTTKAARIAFMTAFHKRLGKNSPVKMLQQCTNKQEILQEIFAFMT